MLPVMDVVRYLVQLGYLPESPEESTYLCPLRLQKLLYYCQGYSLALLSKPLFAEKLQAWKHGPVVPSVYRHFQGQRDSIQPSQVGEPESQIPETLQALMTMVWQQINQYTPRALVEKTHQEPAWMEARAGLPADAMTSHELSEATMRNYFTKIVRDAVPKSKFPMPDPADVWESSLESDLHPGQGVPMQEVMGKAIQKAKRYQGANQE